MRDKSPKRSCILRIATLQTLRRLKMAIASRCEGTIVNKKTYSSLRTAFADRVMLLFADTYVKCDDIDVFSTSSRSDDDDFASRVSVAHFVIVQQLKSIFYTSALSIPLYNSSIQDLFVVFLVTVI